MCLESHPTCYNISSDLWCWLYVPIPDGGDLVSVILDHRDAMQGGLGGGTVSMRPGIDAGESYVREVAAYILVGA